MSADFPSPDSEPEPNGSESGPSANGGSAAEAEAPEFPRHKSRHRQTEGKQAPGSDDEQIVVLSSMLANLMEKKGVAASPAKEGRIFRFRDKKPPIVPAAAAESASTRPQTAPEPAIAAPKPAGKAGKAPAPAASSIAWRNPAEYDTPRRIPGWSYWMLLLVAAGAAFLAGRWTSGHALATLATGPAGPSPASRTLAWSETDVAQLDRMLEADQAGELDKATQLAKNLKAHAGPLPGLEAYLDLLVARTESFDEGASLLKRIISPALDGESLARAENGLAFTYARQRQFNMASDSLRRSTLAEPFAAESFRLLAESLRREGHIKQAIAAFNQALARYPIGPIEDMDTREYVAYKIRLSQIEGSLPVDVRSAATELTATADTNGYWFLSDAALALQQGNSNDAVAALQKAKAALPPALFDKLLEDYFFRLYANIPQVAALLPHAGADPSKAALTPRQVYFIDP